MRRAAVLLVALGCARPSEPVADVEVRRACASACAAVTRASCPSDEPTQTRQSACVSSCLAAAFTAHRARCTSEHREYLACVSARSSGCPPSSLAPGAALENASGLGGCDREHTSYFRCTEPCRETGVVRAITTRLAHQGRDREVRVELVNLGCDADRPKPTKRSEAGAPCTHYTVCSAAECACPGSGAAFSARACIDARCAPSPLACSIAPVALEYEPCR